MKILFTGGGTGGHFYPIIAVVEELNEIVTENHLLRPQIYYMSTDAYNDGLLFDNNINFEKIFSGKIRRKLSLSNLILNFFDLFKIIIGSFNALWRMFIIYPDVVFGKGGYASFPALFAAKLLRIPVIIHESDSTPGKVNAWAAKFARRIAISYPEAISFFDKSKVAYTGNPIRKEIQEPLVTGAHKLLGLSETLPTILILGGSQGSVILNEVVVDGLVELLKKYQVIHQTGKRNIKVIEETRDVILTNNQMKDRYKAFDYLNVLNLRASAGVADLVISRAGSTIFEIASWGKPSIIIPIPEPTSHDQRTNAYSYARSGAAVVIEEKNLASSLLISEINRIFETPGESEKMAKCAIGFARRDSAKLIAQEILAIALEHEN
jgi:UDP-N-acetylglucosamine--N-acetylmuramyl-(pentapeptide) pyrophosphoryl-undecaprenol N-acetylglucosamine transferase